MRCHNTCVKFYVNSSKIFLFLFIFTADMKKKYSDRSICCSNNFNNLLLHVDFKRHNFSFNVIEYYLIFSGAVIEVPFAATVMKIRGVYPK